MKLLIALLLAGALGDGPERPFHTELRATYPAADTVHRAAVDEIRLRFSTAVQLALSTVTLLGPDGVVRGADSLVYVPASSEQELRLPLARALASGDYTVEWRSAGPDGHPIRGEFGFTVDWTPAADTVAPAGAAPVQDTAVADSVVLAPTGGGAAAGEMVHASRPAAAARWLLYMVMAGALGGATFRALVLGRVARTPELGATVEAAERRLTTLGWIAALAGVAALPVLLVLQSAEVFGQDGAAGANLARLIGSSWGGAWLLQGAGVALLLVGLLLVGRARPRTGWALAAAAGVVVALGGALAGHARTEGGWLPVAVQTLHAGAAAVWAGGVAALVLAAIPAARRAPESLARFVAAFSPIALTAVAVLLLTGVINAWDRVGGIGELVSSGYGRVLLVKLALVAGAAAFGLHNRRTVLPALVEQPRAGLIRVPASVELLLQTLVLLATAFLVVLPPAGLTAP